MSAHVQPGRLLRLFFLWVGLILVLPFPGDSVHAAVPQATTISLQMSNPSCVQVLANSGTCSLQMNYLSASGSDISFSRVELLVNGKLRVYVAGFFESSAFLNSPMIPGGIKVTCGRPNAGGLLNFGNVYAVSANAYMADGTSSSNSMNVYCPAYEAKIFLPLARR
jgi:hypothetical protein